MTVENISRSISTKECSQPRRGLNWWPPGLQSVTHPTEPPGSPCNYDKSPKISLGSLAQSVRHLTADPRVMEIHHEIPTVIFSLLLTEGGHLWQKFVHKYSLAALRSKPAQVKCQ